MGSCGHSALWKFSHLLILSIYYRKYKHIDATRLVLSSAVLLPYNKCMLNKLQVSHHVLCAFRFSCQFNWSWIWAKRKKNCKDFLVLCPRNPLSLKHGQCLYSAILLFCSCCSQCWEKFGLMGRWLFLTVVIWANKMITWRCVFGFVFVGFILLPSFSVSGSSEGYHLS